MIRVKNTWSGWVGESVNTRGWVGNKVEIDGVMQFRRAKTLRKIVKCKLFRWDVKDGGKGRKLHHQSNMHFQLINALMQRQPRD